MAGTLIEKYGYTASGRTYLIADANEAWMLAGERKALGGMIRLKKLLIKIPSRQDKF